MVFELDPEEEDGVWMSDTTCRRSFSGYLDDEFTMTEQEIADFIRHSNPQLYERLNGLRAASSHLRSDDDSDPENDAEADPEGWGESTFAGEGTQLRAQGEGKSESQESRTALAKAPPNQPLAPETHVAASEANGGEQYFPHLNSFLLGKVDPSLVKL